MKNKIHKFSRKGLVFIFAILFTTLSAFGQSREKGFLPQGWVIVPHGAIRDPNGLVPPELLDMAKESDVKLIAYDPRAYQKNQTASFYLQALHFDAMAADSPEEFLKGRGECFEKAINEAKGTVLERKLITAYGREFLRIYGYFPPGKKKFIDVFLVFIFIHGQYLDQLSYTASQEYFTANSTTFQGCAAKMLSEK